MSKRTIIDCIVLSLAAIAVVITTWMSLQTMPLVDYGYAVENGFNIFRGLTPYRDFQLVLSPGTYIVMALVMHFVGGFTVLSQLMLTMIVTFGTVAATSFIQRQLSTSTMLLRVVALLPILVTGSAIYTFPLYDLFVIGSILLISLIIITAHSKDNTVLLLFAGICTPFTILFKQNTGLAFSVGVLFMYVLIVARDRNKKSLLNFLYILSGILIGGLAIVFGFLIAGSLYQFYDQTIVYPRTQRNIIPTILFIRDQYLVVVEYVRQSWLYVGIAVIVGGLLVTLSRYRSQTLWNARLQKILQSILVVGNAFLCISLVSPVFNPMRYHHTVLFFTTMAMICALIIVIDFLFKPSKQSRTQVVLAGSFVAAAHATYLSHGIVGSSYGVWPLISILIYSGVITLQKRISCIPWKFLLYPWILLLTLLLTQSLITFESHGFYQRYGEVMRATHPRLVGLSIRGPWISEMEGIVSFIEKLPAEDSFAFFPGEDPLYAITGRANPMPCVQFQSITCLTPPDEYLSLLNEKRVPWVIIKKVWQANVGPGPGGLYNIAENPVFLSHYAYVQDVSWFSIYKRK